MMIERIGAAGVAEMMAVLMRRCVYASLHTERPDFSRPSASEAAAGGYSRVIVRWSEQENGLCYNSEPLLFDGIVPPVQIVAIGLHQTPVSSALEAYGMLDRPVQATGSALRFSAMSLALRIA